MRGTPDPFTFTLNFHLGKTQVSIQLTLSQDAGQLQVLRNGWETRVQNRQQTQYGTCVLGETDLTSEIE